ncbi:Formate dehydrogenase-O, major subunit (EC [Olavius algarvensis associated proteobacterium Delta 3]|nr:Formate dehydrogenase-O, major subunit (EC [Olavius algarvensis associated proteobacterium Delta 3]
MKQIGMMIDLNRCIGCRTCVVACRNYHELFDHQTADPDNIPYYLRVESRVQGAFPDLTMDTWIRPCQHCPEPGCLDACPEGAIAKDLETGVVQIDEEKCTGCQAETGSYPEEKAKSAPCTATCPAHLNVQGYVNMAALGQFDEALKLIKKENPFPAVCGRVCHHPCEEACSRGEKDTPVAINAIKRFIADLDLDPETRHVPAIKAAKDQRVAVVGAGPAGLTCAYFLAREGYPVTVFEQLPVAGGMMAVGIPAYRLPNDILEAEIRVITDMGVDIRTDVALGDDVTIDTLREDGYDALFIASGLQLTGRLDVVGENLPGVHSSLDILKDAALGNPVELGEKVIVIGGGNAAVDAALTVKRLGAKNVSLVCLEQRGEMPAWEHEINDALEENIEIINGLGPMRFVEEDGRLAGVEFQRCTAVFDEDGGFAPAYDDCELTSMEADSAIVSISLVGEREFAEDGGIALTSAGRLWADPLTLQTRLDWVFAGGDSVHGSTSVIEAIASGKQAAASIDRYVRGLDLKAAEERDWTMAGKVFREQYDTSERVAIPRLAPEEREGNFNELEQTLTQDMVMAEAKRCLNCGCACMQSCPFGVLQFDGKAGISHKCNFCYDLITTGQKPVCAEVCLTDALTVGESELLKQEAESRGLAIIEELSRASHLYVK